LRICPNRDQLIRVNDLAVNDRASDDAFALIDQSGALIDKSDAKTIELTFWTMPTGSELKNQELSEALRLKNEFTEQELKKFHLFKDISMTDYVRSGSSYFQPVPLLAQVESSYFQPAPLSQNHCIRVPDSENGRCDYMIT
jgi:hypothetical protein